jgi:(1->4)-alpha-D-glucan 1-alpha-D-glucosylmutase
MRIGLYNDLAVGVDAAGGDHWAHRDVYAGDLRIGAPPDPFNEKGQEWGVIPLHPRQLQRTRYAHFIDLLRANMCCAGALRVDHVMGWRRLFLIPEGAAPADGAYVRYPLDDFLAIAALESRRSRCLLIGEDLGTVPEGFRERMGAENVLSTRILYFERERGRYRPPGDYPARAGISTATHDLPTLRGFWEGEDIKAKARLGIYAGPEGETNAFAERENDKKSLLRALLAEGLISESADAAGVPWSADLARAIHVFLARAPSFLFMAQLDDIAGELHQVNLPGSTIEYPNWRRRQSRSVPDMENDPAILRLMAAINEARS